MIRSILSLLGLLVACCGVGLFIAIGIYVWSIKAEVNRQTATLASRAHAAGDEADRAIKFVRGVIDQAESDLSDTRKRSSTQPSKPVSIWEMTLARSASQQLAGSVERAHGAVATASDAVVVAKTALQVFDDNSELQRLFRVQPGQVDATRTTLDTAATELRQAQSALGPSVSSGTPPPPELLNAVDNALGQARGFTNELAKVVTTVRGRVNDTKSLVDRWTLRLAIGITLISALAAIGQLFLARFCWRKLRGLPA
jgi:hydrogenase maturation protease